MAIRVASVSMETFLVCIKHKLWGANSTGISKWGVGDKLIFKVNDKLMAVATVAGPAYMDDKEIWANGLFWNRLPITFDTVLTENDAVDFGAVKGLFENEWGKKYGWVILNKHPLPLNLGNQLVKMISSK